MAATPNIPAVKRAGLPVDLERLAAEGDEWLTPDDRYALKTYGVCAQAQPGVFMIRIRVPSGRSTPDQARTVADLADKVCRAVESTTDIRASSPAVACQRTAAPNTHPNILTPRALGECPLSPNTRMVASPEGVAGAHAERSSLVARDMAVWHFGHGHAASMRMFGDERSTDARAFAVVHP